MNREEGLILLKEVIEKKKTHQDYERVCELADKYYKMKTGDDITDLLEKIVTRETEEEFEQREDISKSVIPSILNSTQLPFQKAIRKKPLTRSLVFSGQDKTDELENYIANYWGNKSLDRFMEYAVVDYNYIDPNAFLITEFGDFDPNTEKAKPYPFVASSTEAVMFEYENEILQYLIVKTKIKFTKNGNEQDGFKYTMYLGEYTIVLEQAASGMEIGTEFFEYAEYNPKATKVPAQRFGYIRDPETKGRTFVSVYHSVILLLEKLMKTDSELDLSTALTAFPQRFAYVDKCANKECNGGKLLDGYSICPQCNGTGQQLLHSGVKDVVTLTLPRNISDMIDLEKMLVYKTPPIELLQFNKEYINDLRILIHTMMFNNEIVSKAEVAEAVTATQQNFGIDNMNDTLYPFARNYSDLWRFVVEDIATFTDMGEVTVLHEPVMDFKLKTLAELMEDMAGAKNAGASTSTIAAIEDDINEILYADRPADMKKLQIKQALNPFRGQPEATTRLLISQNLAPKDKAVLWANLEAIFSELELDDTELYYKAMPEIRRKVNLKVQEYMKALETPQQPEQLNFQ